MFGILGWKTNHGWGVMCNCHAQRQETMKQLPASRWVLKPLITQLKFGVHCTQCGHVRAGGSRIGTPATSVYLFYSTKDALAAPSLQTVCDAASLVSCTCECCEYEFFFFLIDAQKQAQKQTMPYTDTHTHRHTHTRMLG